MPYSRCVHLLLTQVLLIRWYNNYSVMLQSERLDVAIVATPSGYHLEPVIESAKHGVHVLVSSPMETTLERCDHMIAVCAEANVQLGCISHERFSASLRPVHALSLIHI